MRPLFGRLKEGGITRAEVMGEVKAIFVSDHEIGSHSWKRDVRNLVADSASSVCNLIPPQPHIALQAARARFVVHQYWVKSKQMQLTDSAVGGCFPSNGYSKNGEVIFENEQDVATLQLEIKNVFSFCGCKGDCSTKRCSCRRKNIRCVGCKCASQLCENHFRSVSGDKAVTEDTVGSTRAALASGDTEIDNEISGQQSEQREEDTSSSDSSTESAETKVRNSSSDYEGDREVDVDIFDEDLL